MSVPNVMQLFQPPSDSAGTVVLILKKVIPVLIGNKSRNVPPVESKSHRTQSFAPSAGEKSVPAQTVEQICPITPNPAPSADMKHRYYARDAEPISHPRQNFVRNAVKFWSGVAPNATQQSMVPLNSALSVAKNYKQNCPNFRYTRRERIKL